MKECLVSLILMTTKPRHFCRIPAVTAIIKKQVSKNHLVEEKNLTQQVYRTKQENINAPLLTLIYQINSTLRDTACYQRYQLPASVNSKHIGRRVQFRLNFEYSLHT
jgi:hypothetical protein